tara:strand:+ start:2649 stop:3404 length:756 start_codon:yes stop_codon:yes gene_type:complete
MPSVGSFDMSEFRLGVLVCDHVIEPLRQQFGDYDEMMGRLLSQASAPMTLVYYYVVDGEFPENITDCDGYITTGSRAGANDDEPWIRRLEQFIIALNEFNKAETEQAIKFVGVCFGHQLLAKALGGRVDRADVGWGIGVATTPILEEPSWATAQQDEINLVVSHQDQVVSLPPDTDVILGNMFCPYAMIQVGQHCLGLQGHPEFSRAYSEALMEARRDRIPSDRISAGLASLTLVPDDQLILEWILSFLTN